MQRISRLALLVALGSLLALGGAGACLYQHWYPYGARPCCLPCLLAAMRAFASANNGSFPSGRLNPNDALKVLYPAYLPDPSPLAGLSGDRKLLYRELRAGSPISERASSWVYWAGYRSDDNPEIAIVWERRAGLSFNGRRQSGHAVGFIGGNMRQVQEANWNSFLKEQEALRRKALEERKAGTTGR